MSQTNLLIGIIIVIILVVCVWYSQQSQSTPSSQSAPAPTPQRTPTPEEVTPAPYVPPQEEHLPQSQSPPVQSKPPNPAPLFALNMPGVTVQGYDPSQPRFAPGPPKFTDPANMPRYVAPPWPAGIKPRIRAGADCGHTDKTRGWYDIQNQGVKNDYCRFVGDQPFAACVLAGNLVNQYNQVPDFVMTNLPHDPYAGEISGCPA